ncbi:MAG: 3-isopropylmalate dehydratase small subunit [Sandaracinus sp.]|nr:3-isopropylmalate dehydratase small subunit [Myxococcales bacterium]MCB9601261.1 3-isopropylmalate dehydratase small subunit [Sandaracinus sp.]MCB9611096.1 3-isopropylmalate dehydratase small subunit [Sandaracinus sp.]MCB9634214.1 3-isopropylmalate dehydratase small subunit [Sandaracinus sp.]
MEPFRPFSARVIPLVVDDIDTDQIIPARFLKVTDKVGLGQKLFSDWRYEADGSPKAEFPLNDAKYAGAQVLLAGHNFGCGSSREHAPWSLVDFGFRAVIATSFADIFGGNSLKNGLLPIVLEPALHAELRAAVEADPTVEIHVDLASQTITLPGGKTATFPVDGFAKTMLLEGVDELGYLLGKEAAIAAFEAERV